MVGRCAGARGPRPGLLRPLPATAAAADFTRAGDRAARASAWCSGGTGQPRATPDAGRQRAGGRANNDAAAARPERRAGARAGTRAVAEPRPVPVAVRGGPDPALVSRVGHLPRGGEP